MYDLKKQQYTVPLSKRHRVVIKLSEVRVLYHLMNHQMVPSRVLHDLFKMFVNPIMKSSNISARLKRLIDVDILRRLDESIIFNGATPLQRSFYLLGSRGVNFLQKIGCLLSKDLDALQLQLGQSSIPNLKEQTSTIIVNDVMMYMYHRQLYFEYVRADKHEMFLNTDIFNNPTSTFGLSPAYILEDKSQIVCLIVNPNMRKIRGFSYVGQFILKHYKGAYSHANKVGKKFSLVISVQDGSLNLNSRGGMRNIQEEMFTLKANIQPDFSNSEHFPTYVFPTSRTVTGICESVFGNARKGMDVDGVPKTMSELLDEILLNCNYPLEHMNLKLSFENSRIFFDELYLLTVNGEDRLIGIINGKEGSVNCFNEINSLGRTNGNSLFNSFPISVWVIYDHPTSSTEDFVWNQRNIDIWLTDIETWKDYLKAESYGFPQMMKLTGINRKKYTNFV